MEIYNHKSPYFGCIRVKAGGMDLIEKEGKEGLLEIVKENCKNYRWHLDINSEGYTLTNPTTHQVYSGPFRAKKHIAKGKLGILMKNINDHTVSYNIICSGREEVSKLYRSIRKSQGFDKMLKILNLLEGKKSLQSV